MSKRYKNIRGRVCPAFASPRRTPNCCQFYTLHQWLASDMRIIYSISKSLDLGRAAKKGSVENTIQEDVLKELAGYTNEKPISIFLTIRLGYQNRKFGNGWTWKPRIKIFALCPDGIEAMAFPRSIVTRRPHVHDLARNRRPKNLRAISCVADVAIS